MALAAWFLRLAAHVGAFIKHHRLDQNKTQDVLANEAGISRSTLRLLERGETVTLANRPKPHGLGFESPAFWFNSTKYLPFSRFK